MRAIFPQYGVLVLRYKPAYWWRGALCTVRSWSKYAEGCHLTKTNVVCLKIQYKYLVRRIGRRPCSLRITLHGTRLRAQHVQGRFCNKIYYKFQLFYWNPIFGWLSKLISLFKYYLFHRFLFQETYVLVAAVLSTLCSMAIACGAL